MKYMKLKLIFYFTLLLALFISQSASANNPKNDLTIDDLGYAELQYNIETFKQSTNNLDQKANYNQSILSHQKKLMSITETAYSTQQVITVLIFIIVSILVLGGIYLSYLQFKNDVSLNNDNGESRNKATFKIGKDGIEFSSSVIGIIVLFMSFLFFHMYIKDVYTIKTHKVSALNFDQGSNVNNK